MNSCYSMSPNLCSGIIVDFFLVPAFKLKFSYKQENLLLKNSPVALPKSIKNPTEIKGMKNAHVSNITSNSYD